MRFEVFKGKTKKTDKKRNKKRVATKSWYWRMKSGNGQIQFIGGEAYDRKANAERAARWLARNAGKIKHAPIVVVEG